MLNWTTIGLVVAGITAVLAGVMAVRTDITHERGGKMLAFIALFLLPGLALSAGLSHQLERSKSTQFCLSCHVMADYGKSLHVADKSYLAAAHYQNNRVPRDQACYTCHSDYTMYGGLTAKMRGLRHVYIQYLGTIPKPEDLKLYSPFNNRECLHCHAGARSFLEVSAHRKNPELLKQVSANTLSCMSSRCHDTVHDVANVAAEKLWSPEN